MDHAEIEIIAELHKTMSLAAHRTDDRIYSITIYNYAGVGAILSFSGGENGLFHDNRVFVGVFALLISLTAAQAVRRYSASVAIQYRLQNLALKAWVRRQTLEDLNALYKADELTKIEMADLPEDEITKLSLNNRKIHRYSYQVFFNAAPGVFVATVVFVWTLAASHLGGLGRGLQYFCNLSN